jgi:hypothetical protein
LTLWSLDSRADAQETFFQKKEVVTKSGDGEPLMFLEVRNIERGIQMTLKMISLSVSV